MALAQSTVVYDVHDAKVYPLLTDATNASPSYGTGVDIPGISQVSFDPNIVSAELKGDASVIARKGRTDRFNFSAQFSKISLPVMKTIMGGQIDELTADTRTQFFLDSPASLPYFKFAFKIDDLDVGLGSLIVTLMKCQITGATLMQQQSDQFGQPTFQGQAISPDGNMPMALIDLWSTTQTLS